MNASSNGRTKNSKSKHEDPTPEESVAPLSDRKVEAGAGALAAATGALAGVPAGPVGAAVGAVLGGIVGAVGAHVIRGADRERQRHDEELDRDIGVDGGTIGVKTALKQLEPEPAPSPRSRPMISGVALYERILLPVDFSESASTAVAHAGDLARQSNAELVLLHVIDDPHGLSEEGRLHSGAWSDPTLWELIRKTTKERLDKMADDLEATGIRVQSHIVTGRPAEQITRAAANLNVDLIVMGTHSRGGLKRVMMGSVAERVVRTAECSVLTQRGTFLENLADEDGGSHGGAKSNPT